MRFTASTGLQNQIAGKSEKLFVVQLFLTRPSAVEPFLHERGIYRHTGTNGDLTARQLCYMAHGEYIPTRPFPGAIERHLAQLREAGLVSDRREGQWNCYRIHDTVPDYVVRIRKEASAGAAQLEPYKSDHAVLAAMPNFLEATRCA